MKEQNSKSATTSHSAFQILKAFAYIYELPGFFYLVLKMPDNNSSVRSEYVLITPHLPCCAYPAVSLLILFSLTLLCPFPAFRLPLTLLCSSLFYFHLPCCAFSRFSLPFTLLCPSLFYFHLPCCALSRLFAHHLPGCARPYFIFT